MLPVALAAVAIPAMANVACLFVGRVVVGFGVLSLAISGVGKTSSAAKNLYRKVRKGATENGGTNGK